jgi:hypothetical protein
VQPECRDRKVLPDHKDHKDCRVLKVPLDPQVLLVAQVLRVQLVLSGHRVSRVALGLLAPQGQLALLGHKALLDQQDLPDKPDQRVLRDQQVLQAILEKLEPLVPLAQRGPRDLLAQQAQPLLYPDQQGQLALRVHQDQRDQPQLFRVPLVMRVQQDRLAQQGQLVLHLLFLVQLVQ